MSLAQIPDFFRKTKASLRRSEWSAFSDVIIHADESAVKKHPMYEAAKAGDSGAAETLVLETSPIGALDKISEVLSGARPHLLAVHALETIGVNAIPQVFAKTLSRILDLPVATASFRSTGSRTPERADTIVWLFPRCLTER